LLFVVLAAGNASRAQDSSFTFDGRERTYRVHLPPAYSDAPDSVFSLIMALHGGLGSASNLEDQSQLSAKADTAEHPFIVVYPEGVKNLLGIRTWNAGRCCGYARDENVDDVGFIDALIDTLKSHYRVDPDRVYATGISNGGMLAYRLAVDLAGRIAAVAPVAATGVLNGVWRPVRPVPVIHFHSLVDDNVPIEGGVGDGLSDHWNSPVDSVLTVLSELNACTMPGIWRIDDPDAYYWRSWTGCSENAELQLYVSYDGGHSWPGGHGTVVGDPPSQAVSADDLMWAFFLEHPRTGDSTPSERVELPQVIRIEAPFPNPFLNETTMIVRTARPSSVVVRVRDVLGRVVRHLASGVLPSGRMRVLWDGRDDAGRDVAAGMYFLELETSGPSPRPLPVIRTR
jgi:polyhydroxybutyrate depolymerase